MRDDRQTFSPALRIAMIAILTAVTTVFTLLIRIPSPAKGYFNLGDAAITFIALAFGPVIALITGGLGTALADLIGAYVQWAPISFLVHGLQGFIIGVIFQLKPTRTYFAMIAGAAGVVVMSVGYALGGTVLMGIGPALSELPGNIIQSVAGVVIGIPLLITVTKAYPPILHFAGSWTLRPALQQDIVQRPSLIEMRVSLQNSRIGSRNIHRIPEGKSLSVGGGASSFKIFLFSVPKRLGEIRNDDGKYAFVPLRKEYFPLLSNPVSDCLGVDIIVRTSTGKSLILYFQEWESPLEQINRVMRSV